LKKIIVSDKIYIPREEYDLLPKSLKKKLTTTFSLEIQDPNLCDIRARSLKCNFLLEDKTACSACEHAHKVIKCYRKTSKWFVFDKGNRPLAKSFVRQIKDKTDLHIKDKEVYPILPISKQFSINEDTSKDIRNVEQQKVVNDWLKQKYGQIILPPRSGKCVSGDTLICTSKGIIPIKQAVINNEPITISTVEQNKNVSNFYEKDSDSLITIKTSNGYSIKCTREHPLLVLGSNLSLKWKEAFQLEENDVICINKKEGCWSDNNACFNEYSPISYTNIEFPKMSRKLARLMGYLVSDGYYVFNNLLNIKKNHKDIDNCLKIFGNVKISNFFVSDFLHFAGLKLEDREIPYSILQSKREIVIHFLKAYFSNNYSHNFKKIRINCNNKKIAVQLQIILNNFGIISFKKKYKLFKKSYYRLYISEEFRQIFQEIFFVKKTFVKVKKKSRDLTEFYDKNIKFLDLESKISNLLKKPFSFDKVISCKEKFGKFKVYDLTVPKIHNFIANGIISHNTVIGAMLASKLNTRTAIIIHQKELLDQFYNTFIKFTDIESKGKIDGHALIKINPKPSEVPHLAVALYTWQQFISKQGKERLKEVSSLIGLLIVDESHRMSSDVYSEVVSRFKAKYRCGLTATPNRKDKLDFRQTMILGPPIITGGTEQLSCEYSIIHTNWDIPTYKEWNNKTWNYFFTRLSKEKKRNELIIDHIKDDLDNGYKIIIPVKRIVHAELLMEMVNKFTDKAVLFVANIKNRKQVSEEIRAGKYDVVIATKQLISLGFDAPKMSCLYCVVPTFDKNSFYQEYSRIRTPSPGKKTPLIKIFKDEGGICDAFVKKALTDFTSKGFNEV